MHFLPSTASREDDTNVGLEVDCWEVELDEGVLWKCRPWLISAKNLKTNDMEILRNCHSVVI